MYTYMYICKLPQYCNGDLKIPRSIFKNFNLCDLAGEIREWELWKMRTNKTLSTRNSLQYVDYAMHLTLINN